ncbi:MAG TPA: hypothetical protein VFS17_05490, partial [Methylophilaceae bacterium]|nr:hypothetical protein [Methylophilaceae bacterium]
VEQQIRREYGGSEVWISPPEKIPKQKKDKAVKEYLDGKPVEEVTVRNGISRATLYRHLKRQE